MRHVLRMVAVVAWVLSGAATAQDRPAVEQQFQAWRTDALWPAAEAVGVSRATFDRAFAGVTLDWGLPELQPPGAPAGGDEIEWQAEFRSPGAYFAENGLAALAREGRKRIGEWRATLDAIEARYGVPAGVIVAIWGKETVYGTYPLPEPAIRALATHAFMGRRATVFQTQLIAALQILENGDIAPERMLSSWAGALGQPQFQPTSYLAYAVDFDGDGHRDIWDSVPDTLASIANYLARHGWQRDRGVAYEVVVPADVSCALEGPDNRRPAAEWAAMGVARADGQSLPDDGGRPAYLVMSGGRYGPAFLATENFYAIREYNRSDLYALYISHLADRFSDDRAFRTAWVPVDRFSRGDVRRLQERLEAEGHDIGTLNGLLGYQTRVAVGLTQQRLGLPVTCLPDAALINAER